jgi:hypothetical protein
MARSNAPHSAKLGSGRNGVLRGGLKRIKKVKRQKEIRLIRAPRASYWLPASAMVDVQSILLTNFGRE